MACPCDQPGDGDFVAIPGRMPEDLKDYWTHGEGAAKIRWGTEGAFKRCVRHLRKYFPQEPEGLCARLHHAATGEWPRGGIPS